MPIPVYGPVTNLTQNAASNQYWGHVTALQNGNFAAAWFDETSFDVQIRTFKADGTATGALVTIAATVPSAFSAIDIAALSDGRFIVAWQDNALNGGDVLAQVFNNTGSTSIAAFTVNTALPGSQGQPIVAAQSTGEFFVGFTDFNTTPDNILAKRYNSNGTLNSGPFDASYFANTTNDSLGAVAVAADNTQLWVYRAETGGNADLKGQGINASTTSYIGAEITISDVNSRPANDASSPMQLVRLSSGQFAAAWEDTGGELHYRIINGDGTFATGILSAATGITRLTDITALLDGGFILGYDSNGGGDGFVRQFAANGTAVDVAQALLPGSGSFDGGVDLTTLADGRVLASFYEYVGGLEYEMKAQVYDPRIAAINLTGTSGADNYVGSAFNDTIDGVGGDDSLLGGAGNDLLQGGLDGDTISGGEGNDLIFAMNQANPNGSGVGDVLIGDAGNDTFYGANGSDTINGGDDIDEIYASGGSDTCFGGDGIDTIYTGSGADYIQGDGGASSILAGEAGNDTIYGGAGDDYMIGGADNDTLVGNGGINSMYGGTGDDLLISGDGAGSVIDGGAGANQLWGGSGGDYAVGGELVDTIITAGGSDFIFGNAGADGLYAGAGTDYIYGNAGNDFIYTDDIGFADRDFIYIGGGTNVDTVVDFTTGNGANADVIVVALGNGVATFAQAQANLSQVGIYTVLTLFGGDQLYLYNVTTAQLTANNFIFL